MNHRSNPIPLGPAACAVLAAAATAIAAEHAYIFTELGTLGGAQSAAFGLNDNRQVVGWATVSGSAYPHAFLWENGVMTDLDMLAGDDQSIAWAINNDGLIVGTSARDAGGYLINHAFVYSDSLMTALPGLGGGWNWASDINSSGIIAGMAENAYFQEQAVIWDGGDIFEIGQDSTQQRQRAYGINNNGTIVGWEYTPMMGPNDAFMYDGVHWTVIGGTDSDLQNAEAYDINENNVVVGLSNFPQDECYAAMWLPDNPTEAINLGTLPGFEVGELYAVNNSGCAVGAATKYDPQPYSHAILYDGTELLDLNDYLPDRFDGHLWEAQGINDNGDIIATALTSQGWSAYLLTLEEASCPADFDGDGDVDTADLLFLLGAWGTPDGDVDDDGDTDTSDLLALLAAWGECP